VAVLDFQSLGTFLRLRTQFRFSLLPTYLTCCVPTSLGFPRGSYCGQLIFLFQLPQDFLSPVEVQPVGGTLPINVDPVCNDVGVWPALPKAFELFLEYLREGYSREHSGISVFSPKQARLYLRVATSIWLFSLIPKFLPVIIDTGCSKIWLLAERTKHITDTTAFRRPFP